MKLNLHKFYFVLFLGIFGQLGYSTEQPLYRRLGPNWTPMDSGAVRVAEAIMNVSKNFDFMPEYAVGIVCVKENNFSHGQTEYVISGVKAVYRDAVFDSLGLTILAQNGSSSKQLKTHFLGQSQENAWPRGLEMSRDAFLITESLLNVMSMLGPITERASQLTVEHVKRKDVTPIQVKYDVSGDKLDDQGNHMGRFRLVITRTLLPGIIINVDYAVKISVNT